MVQASTEEIYPNLYTLFIAPSTLYTKSTGLNIVDKLLYRAGLSHLLLPQRATPQALVNDLCVQKLPGQQGVDLDKFLKRRAFAAQRSYIRDEVSSLFAEMRRDFNAGLLELILELYNCKPEVTEMTISRGDITIRDTYMSFLGVSTPSEMAAHLTNSAFWSNGLWARFALLSPDEPPRYAFYPQQSEGMGDLAARLRTIYNLFPEPAARLVSEEDDQGKPVSSIQVANAQAATPAQLESGVWEAWRAYHKACHDMLQGNSVEEELHPNYGRFPGMVMKTAMVLAVMDSETLPIQIDLAHYARAQQIVERWRVSLHRIWKQQAETEDEINARRIYDYLKRTGGADSRALQQMLHIRARPVKEALEVLEESGQVEGIKTGRRVIWTAC
jgi:hypothetical protein